MTRDVPPTEAALRRQLEAEGLHVTRWSNEPHAVYRLHDHPYHKVLVVSSGSLVFTVGSEQRPVAMRPGDRLELPPRTAHSAVVGPDGVACLEAHVDGA